MNKVANWFVKQLTGSPFIIGWAIGGWITWLQGDRSIPLMLFNFAIAGLLGAGHIYFHEQVEKSNSDIEKTNNPIRVDAHKVCCDCEDPELHEEALKEVDEYLNGNVIK